MVTARALRQTALKQSLKPLRSVVIPAPVAGWNVKDSEAAMAPIYANVLDNFFPNVGEVVVRKGYTEHATTMGSGNVDTLFSYEHGTVLKILAGANGNIYDATATGAASDLTGAIGDFSENRWQVAQFDEYAMFVNGTDAVYEYDGSTVAAATISGSGLTTTDLIDVMAFKNRMIYIEKNSQSFWFSNLDARAGVLVEFPLGNVSSFGGNLIACGTWSRTSGITLDDLAVFIFSSGDVVVYAGTDPADSSAWSLAGVYRVGMPIDRRGVVKNGGDLIIMTDQGYQSLERIVSSGQGKLESSISGDIDPAVVERVRDFGSSTGWEAVLYAESKMLIVNVPLGSMVYEQHVMNTQTQAWCKFSDIPARTFVVHAGNLYFGGIDGRMMQADNSFQDEGVNIVSNAEQAYNGLGIPSVPKTFHYILPSLVLKGTVSLGVGVSVDFSSVGIDETAYTLDRSSDPWGVISDTWNGTSLVWGQGGGTSEHRFGVRGHGFYAGTHLKISSDDEVRWLATRTYFRNARTN